MTTFAGLFTLILFSGKAFLWNDSLPGNSQRYKLREWVYFHTGFIAYNSAVFCAKAGLNRFRRLAEDSYAMLAESQWLKTIAAASRCGIRDGNKPCRPPLSGQNDATNSHRPRIARQSCVDSSTNRRGEHRRNGKVLATDQGGRQRFVIFFN